MRAGIDSALVYIVAVFGATKPHCPLVLMVAERRRFALVGFQSWAASPHAQGFRQPPVGGASRKRERG